MEERGRKSGSNLPPKNFGIKYMPTLFLPSRPEASWCSATWLKTYSPLTSRAKDQPLRTLQRLSPRSQRTLSLNIFLLSTTLLGFSNLFPFPMLTFLSLCIPPPLFGFSFSLLSPLNFHFKCSPFFKSSPSSPTPYCLLLIWSSKPMSLYKPKQTYYPQFSLALKSTKAIFLKGQGGICQGSAKPVAYCCRFVVSGPALDVLQQNSDLIHLISQLTSPTHINLHSISSNVSGIFPLTPFLVGPDSLCKCSTRATASSML